MPYRFTSSGRAHKYRRKSRVKIETDGEYFIMSAAAVYHIIIGARQ